MKVKFLEEAHIEFLNAIAYYENARHGLGRRFKDEIDRCILWITDHPEIYPLRSGGYRRINCRIFPYYISYIVRDTTLWVLAISHGHRRPEYWIGRHQK